MIAFKKIRDCGCSYIVKIDPTSSLADRFCTAVSPSLFKPEWSDLSQLKFNLSLSHDFLDYDALYCPHTMVCAMLSTVHVYQRITMENILQDKVTYHFCLSYFKPSQNSRETVSSSMQLTLSIQCL